MSLDITTKTEWYLYGQWTKQYNQDTLDKRFQYNGRINSARRT